MHTALLKSLAPSFLLATLFACSGPSDGSLTSGDGGGEEQALWRCDAPGSPCNAHDACAIDPICGEDLWCRARTWQDCDDGLACTLDSCAGAGVCRHRPQAGICVLVVRGEGGSAEKRCVEAGAVDPQNPCNICDPQVDQERWSPRTGGTCDDGQACTMNDRCEDGVCRGEFYGDRCNDGLDCTTDSCDGEGKCTNEREAQSCVIAGACYDKGARDPSGCKSCQPETSASEWTALEGVCTIGGRCYLPQERDSSGCGSCEPATKADAWSPAPDRCFVEGRCLKAGARAASGCGRCDPKRSKTSYSIPAGECEIGAGCHAEGTSSPSGCSRCTASTPDRWSPLDTVQLQAIDFEEGVGGLTIDPPTNAVGWQRSTERAHTGSYSLYYGNPLAHNYLSSGRNAGSFSMPLTLAAGGGAALSFWLYLDVEPTAGSDQLSVSLGDQILWEKPRATLSFAPYRRWLFVQIDLSPYAGSTGELRFRFDSKDAWDNDGQGVFIDEIQLLSSCGGG